MPLCSNGLSETRPFVSVIVPVYRDCVGLKRCLSALARQCYPRERFEVFVVDNEGNPAVRSICASCGDAVHYLLETRPGSYAARNAALAKVRGEVLAFTDSDCTPDPHWIDEAIAALVRNPRVGVVGGRVDVVARNPARPTASEAYDCLFAFPQQRDITRNHKVVTANCITTRAVMQKVGPFDQRVMSGGDVDWSRRAFEMGFELLYVPGAIVRHPARRSLAGQLKKLRRTTAGQSHLYRKNPGMWRAFSTPAITTAFLPPLRTVVRTVSLSSSNYQPAVRLKAALVLLMRHYYKLGCVIYYKLSPGAAHPRQ